MRVPSTVPIGRRGERRTMRGREPYLSAAATLLAESGCTVRNWRSSTTGSAYTKDADWGIEVPEPRGPLSYGTFAHEIGHQLLHRANSLPRWVEEVEAWEFALSTFDRFGLPGADRVEVDAATHLAQVARKTIRHAKHPESMWLRLIGRWPTWALDFLLAADGRGLVRKEETP